MMKKIFYLSLCAVMLLQACKKEEQTADTGNPIKQLPDNGPIMIPDIPEGTTPVTGEPPAADDPSSADIVYKNLNLCLGYNKHIYLDADADGKNDFTFSSVLIGTLERPYLYLLASTKSNTGNKLLLQNGPELIINALYTYPFEKGQLIKPTEANNGKWSETMQKGFILGVSETAASKEQYGLWVGKRDKYMGISLNVNGKTHYGWIKLSHDHDHNEIIVSSFAYNKVAGAGISAGQK